MPSTARGLSETSIPGSAVAVTAETLSGRSPFQLIIDPALVSDDLRARMLVAAESWLDEIDPRLRLVSGLSDVMG